MIVAQRLQESPFDCVLPFWMCSWTSLQWEGIWIYMFTCIETYHSFLALLSKYTFMAYLQGSQVSSFGENLTTSRIHDPGHFRIATIVYNVKNGRLLMVLLFDWLTWLGESVTWKCFIDIVKILLILHTRVEYGKIWYFDILFRSIWCESCTQR